MASRLTDTVIDVEYRQKDACILVELVFRQVGKFQMTPDPNPTKELAATLDAGLMDQTLLDDIAKSYVEWIKRKMRASGKSCTDQSGPTE